MSTSASPSASRRRVPPLVVLLLLLLVPVAELWTMVQVGQGIGVGWTILALVAAGLLGLWLVKREGLRTWRALGEALREGRMPHREIADGVLVVTGGFLLITPGFLTDAVGLLLVLPVLRPLTRRLLAGVVAGRLTAAYDATGTVRPPGTPAGPSPYGATGAPGPSDTSSRRPRVEGEVVRGEVVDP